MAGYYDDKLSADRLKRCYEVASPRVRQYLEAEIVHLLGFVDRGTQILELGCGYGRILERLCGRAGEVAGIDTSLSSLVLAKGTLGDPIHVAVMDAVRLAFADASFDTVACVQNGLSAFKVDRLTLLRECLRVTRPGGRVVLSSYAARFWDARLEWFERQADAGLIGAIDHAKTGDGVIVCHDGFVANTISPDEFTSLCTTVGLEPHIEEVDESSLFCTMHVSE